MNTRIPVHAWLSLLAATALWGGLFSVGKLLSHELPSFTATCARYGLPLVLLVPLAFAGLRAVRRADLPLLALAGLLSSVGFNGFMFLGLQHTPAGDAVLAPASVPLMVTAIGALWLGEKPSRRRVAFLGLSLAGLLAMIAAGMQGHAGLDRAFGDFMHLGAAASWSAYVVLSPRLAARYSPMVMTTVTGLAGALGSLPLALWEGGFARFATLSPTGWACVAYLAGMGSVVAFLLWVHGARQVGPQQAAMFMNLVPVWGVLCSLLLLREHLNPAQAAGMAMVLAGIWGASWTPKPKVRAVACPAGSSA